jgi:hypothetical protein
MPITVEKPVTRDEFDERMALAKQYGPHAVANLVAEFRRRVAPAERLELMDRLADLNLQKCGLDAAKGSVESADPERRLGKRRLNIREQKRLDEIVKDHSGPPTIEERIELLRLTARPGEEEIVEKIIAQNFGTAPSAVAKRYTPTQAQIVKDGELLINFAGF